MPEPRWYALTSRHQHEKPVASALQLRGFHSFLPLYRSRRRWSDRLQTLDLPLFPSYVFCELDPARRGLALAVPGVTGIVGFGGRPEPIPDLQMRNLLTVANSGLPARPCEHLKAGDEVVIDDGPLRGLRGRLLRDGAEQHLVVGVDLLQRSVAVTLTHEQAWPAEAVRALHAHST